MCRWLAYYGDPIPLELLLFKRQHSLIDQSLHSRLGATTTNGDGFGVGWYGAGDEPGLYRSVHPAWNDRNLQGPRQAHLRAGLLRAHPRLDGDADPGVELPPVPPRAVAVHAQRRGARVRQGAPRPDARDRPGALPAAPGLGRLRGPVLPRAHVRARGRPGGRARADGRVRRGGRRAPRRRAPADDVGRRHGRDEDRRRRATRASTTRGRSTSAPTRRRSSSSTRSSRRSRRSPTRLARSSRSRSATWSAPGTRCRSRASGSSSRGRTRCTRSRRAADSQGNPRRAR